MAINLSLSYKTGHETALFMCPGHSQFPTKSLDNLPISLFNILRTNHRGKDRYCMGHFNIEIEIKI